MQLHGLLQRDKERNQREIVFAGTTESQLECTKKPAGPWWSQIRHRRSPRGRRVALREHRLPLANRFACLHDDQAAPGESCDSGCFEDTSGSTGLAACDEKLHGQGSGTVGKLEWP